MGRLIDADALKIDISRLHALNDEAEIRRAYELNPHSTMTDFEDTLVSVFDAIDDAPTIEVPKWIPCSERLPEYLEEVLMSTFWGVRVGFRDHTERSGDFWNIIENDSTVAPHSVYAWMPLPKPYEEADHE